ncbi:YncE family protein [Undibacterium sp. Ji50W]|uniref:YncE family protein n=1 Tax=Undibacterium sp. Ji50W TaxID=3413041 RepID=UPI003BF365F9
MFLRHSTVFGCSLVLLGFLASQAHSAEPLQTVLHLDNRVELPEYTGDFDHFAVDVKGKRLFLAAEDHGTLEVFDLISGKHLKTINGVEIPHGILYLEDSNRLVVTDSGAGHTKIFDASTYQLIGSIQLKPGADSMGYDTNAKNMYIVTGGKNGNLANSFLAKVNPHTGKQVGELKFDTDKVEAMAIEETGKHLYINVTGMNHVAVVDKENLSVVKTWPIAEGKMNAAMAFDEVSERLFVVTRKPYQLLILNTKTGATVASFAAPERTNEAIFDKQNRRIYLAGDDFIGVYQQDDADHYHELARVPSAHGAKTAIFVPQLSRFYAAVSPGDGNTGAAVLNYNVEPLIKEMK